MNDCLSAILRDIENNEKAVKTVANAMLNYTLNSAPAFEPVSFKQFKNDWVNALKDYADDDADGDILSIYKDIKEPCRATSASAGYDFFSPISFYLKPNESIMIPTGIRVHMDSDMVLMIYPRSGLSTKFRLVPKNLTAVIDSDYYNADNEGHIHMCMVNDGDKIVTVERGQAFCQGVFTKYHTVMNDAANGTRFGGFGSTDGR